MSNENLNIGFFNIKYSSVRLKSFRDNRKAISPVISTIIIVAVAIAISIAVAFWLGGITSIFTRFEKLEITSAYAVSTTFKTSNNDNTTGPNAYSSGDGWEIVLELKNTGTTDTTITDIFINNIPISAYSYTTKENEKDVRFNATWSLQDNYNKASSSVTGVPLKTGSSVTIYVWLTKGAFTAGQAVTVTIHTAGGQDYPKTVTLP